MTTFGFMSESSVQRIHEASLDLLEATGVRVGESLVRRLLLEHGCSEKGNGVVGIPRELVAEATGRVQPPLVCHGTHPSRSVTADGSACYLHNFGTVSAVVDLDSGDMRDVTVQDTVDMVRLLDELPHCHLVMPMIFASDMHPRKARLATAAAILQFTGKPVFSLGVVSDALEAELCVELSRVVSAPGRTIGGILISPISPLTFPADICEAIAVAAASGLPTVGLSCPLRSLGAPLYLAGALLGQNAENLAFAVMARLVNPDVPLVHVSRILTPNMRTGAMMFGDPDTGLAAACMVHMAKFYGLPSSVAGPGTGSFVADAQAGFEKAASILRPMMAGVDFVSGLGTLGNGLVASFTQAAIDDEIFSYLSHHLGGPVVETGTMDLDGFHRVLHNNENFLAQEATVEALHRGEVWQGRLCNTDQWEDWVACGRKTTQDRAHQFVKDTLAADPVHYLDEDRVAALSAIVDRA